MMFREFLLFITCIISLGNGWINTDVLDKATLSISKLTWTKLEPCDICDAHKCPPVTRCNVGLVRDRCDCCDVCGLEESQLCNLDVDISDLKTGKKQLPWHGRCGIDLECRLREDIDVNLVGSQSICYCLKEGKVCGSDKVTYSKCQLTAVTAASNGTIKGVSYGPCKSAPTNNLTAPSEPLAKGSNVTLICEARGYPNPDISWVFNKPELGYATHQLPGGSKDITMSVHGGPEETCTISYLQITNFNLDHEGNYTCLAENVLGLSSQVASLVLGSDRQQI